MLRLPVLGPRTQTPPFAKERQVLHPTQFKVNEAWVAFRLNDEPIHTQLDGDFHFFALMDAASGFILNSAPVPVEQAEPTRLESLRLLKEAQTHKQRWPKTLFVSSEQPARFLVAEAEVLGIEVIGAQEVRLGHLIDEAQEGFRERFGGQGAQ